VPNLKTDRLVRFGGKPIRVDVRRLMYQSLICADFIQASDDPGRVPAPIDPEDANGAADPLIYGVWRNAQSSSDFLAVEVLGDKLENLNLSVTQPSDAILDRSGTVLDITSSDHPKPTPSVAMRIKADATLA
jgi:hypothetical protein